MNRGKELLYSLSLVVASMLFVCTSSAAQGAATISVVSTSCSGGSCKATISWNDPSNPYPVDYVTQSQPELGSFWVDSGNSGEYTAYNISIFPVAFQLYDADGDWLADVVCYSSGNGYSQSMEC